MKVLFLISSCFFTWQREGALASFSSYKDPNLIIRVPPSWPCLNPITSQKSHLLILSHWVLGFQHTYINFRGDQNIQSITDTFTQNYSIKTLFLIISSVNQQDRKERRLKINIRPEFFFIFLKLKYSWFTILCQSLLYSKVTVLHTHTHKNIYIYSFFNILFHYGLSQEIRYSSLCYIVGPCCLSILNVLVYIYWILLLMNTKSVWP